MNEDYTTNYKTRLNYGLGQCIGECLNRGIKCDECLPAIGKNYRLRGEDEHKSDIKEGDGEQ